MVYTSGKVDCYGAYDYVKGMLNTIGEVKAFRAFYEENEDYSRSVNGEKEYYRFIIINTEGDEFWIDGICGYGGTGPTCTKKMLELLGIDGDFGLFEKKEVYVNEVNQQHKMNVLIEYQKDDDELIPCFMLKIEFNTAYDRLMFHKAIRTIGYINEYRHGDWICKEYEQYFKDCPQGPERYGEYRWNNMLSLNRKLKDYTNEQVENLIETMILNSRVKEYTLMEV